jgi:pyruvate,water dikinase
VKNWLKNLIRYLEPEEQVSVEDTLRAKYRHFQHFLDARKEVLAELGAPRPADPRIISGQVAQVLHSLNDLSGGRQPDLFLTLQEIEKNQQEVDPEKSPPPEFDGPSAGFLRPSACRAFQDLLARAHDLAIEEMFTLLDKIDLGKAPSQRVKTGLPINLHVIDLVGGLVPEGESKLLPRDQIVSLPLQAMFKGMYYPGITWSGPIGINLKGFMVIMAQSTSRPEEDFWDRTYALIAREYMAYHSRLGYHYTSVDAYCTDETWNNHIRFLFKGGAADDLRRALRARFIGGVLERIGFAVEVQGDLVNARFHRMPRPEVESRLDLLGRLMGCSRQRDMVMKNDSIVNWHIEAFLRGNYSFTPED